jgi:uncharacterized membrane protein
MNNICEKGGITILTLVFVALLLLFVPVIIDTGILLNTHVQLQNAADAAALAAMQEFFLGGSYQTAAQTYARLNGTQLVDLKVFTDSVIAKTRKAPPLIFVNHFGIRVPDLTALGKAELKDVEDQTY